VLTLVFWSISAEDNLLRFKRLFRHKLTLCVKWLLQLHSESSHFDVFTVISIDLWQHCNKSQCVLFFLGMPTSFLTFTRPILKATMSRFLPVQVNRAAETWTALREPAATPAFHGQVFDTCFLHYLSVFRLLQAELQKYVVCKYRFSCLINQRRTKRLVNVI